MVGKYKYLGIWFTSDLSWHEHISVVLSKVASKTRALSKLFSNKRVPARAKVLVWLASARPNLEYGSEVWTPTPAEARALDAAQTHAGVLCFALNRKANAHAVRSLMHVPSLGLRRTRSKLIYLVKLKCMEDNRLVRRLAGGVAGSQLHWSRRS